MENKSKHNQGMGFVEEFFCKGFGP